MMSPQTRAKYIASIGIECHVQLSTKTKLFSAVDNDARKAEPNTLISHIDLGMPGALPVLNEKAVEYAVRMAFAFNTEPQTNSFFERKHYFYPDLPKGYQITQLSHPIIKGGYVVIEVDGKAKKVQLTRVQLEEDAGKNIHPSGKDYSLVDLNRAGTPLLEIVSEPDMHSAKEARAYVRELYLLARYAGVSEADLFHGNMRFDVNVSVSKDPDKLGIRSETKNLNSFRSVEKTVEYEIGRQIDELERDKQIIQETRGWDDAKQKTFSQRGKEEAHDYRYMPEPDIPPIEINEGFVKKVKKQIPQLPGYYRNMFKKLEVNRKTIEDILSDNEHAKGVAAVLEKYGPAAARKLVFWMMLTHYDEDETRPLRVKEQILTDQFASLAQMVDDKQLSSSAAKEVFREILGNGGDPLEIAKKRNLLQVSEEGVVSEIVIKVISKHPKAAEDIRNGEVKAIGFLVGQVMKASQGKANPELAQKLLRKQLGV